MCPKDPFVTPSHPRQWRSTSQNLPATECAASCLSLLENMTRDLSSHRLNYCPFLERYILPFVLDTCIIETFYLKLDAYICLAGMVYHREVYEYAIKCTNPYEKFHFKTLTEVTVMHDNEMYCKRLENIISAAIPTSEPVCAIRYQCVVNKTHTPGLTLGIGAFYFDVPHFVCGKIRKPSIAYDGQLGVPRCM